MGIQFLLCFVLCCILDVTSGQDVPCTGRDQCSCMTSNGKIIDLSSVGNTNGKPKFSDMQAPDGYMYSYNPCYPFDEINCKGQSVCQIPPKKDTSYQAGDANSAVFSYDGVNNHVKYSSTDSAGVTRKTDVTLVCDPTGAPAALTVLGEKGSSPYYLTLTTKCACPDGCTNGPPPTDPPGKHSNGGGGISVGTILCIAVLSMGFLYLIGGVLFMKLLRNASGTAMIPNSEFWVAVPGNIKNGFQFTIRKIKGQGGYTAA